MQAARVAGQEAGQGTARFDRSAYLSAIRRQRRLPFKKQHPWLHAGIAVAELASLVG